MRTLTWILFQFEQAHFNSSSHSNSPPTPSGDEDKAILGVSDTKSFFCFFFNQILTFATKFKKRNKTIERESGEKGGRERGWKKSHTEKNKTKQKMK